MNPGLPAEKYGAYADSPESAADIPKFLAGPQQYNTRWFAWGLEGVQHYAALPVAASRGVRIFLRTCAAYGCRPMCMCCVQRSEARWT